MSTRRFIGALLLACVAASLLAGIAGGLFRLGLAIASPDATWLGRAALAHAALMVCGFMGTVVSIERAVAAKQRFAWATPLASGMAALALLGGADALATWLLVAAGSVFIAVNVLLLHRQRASHTGLLLVSAAAWFVGNVLYALGAGAGAVVPWWFAFLVMTIAAERLEMTRMMRRRPGAQPALFAILALLVLGAAGSSLSALAGGVLYGLALSALALWLFTFDIALRTVRADGLSRYMAVCLLGGYAWLAVGGLAWVATALGFPARDGALHALGLGFVVSMIMGHAPVILPAVTRIKVLYGPVFYLPLAALHLSLAWRLAAGFSDIRWRGQGAVANALALAVFALTMAGAALAWRRRHRGGALPSRPTP